MQAGIDMNDSAHAVASEPHTAELTVWDVPSVTVAGERFHFMVGARCSAGCDLGGRELGIYDEKGACISTAKLGREVWPGTEALYVAEVQISAPPAGNCQWELKAVGWDGEMQHMAGAFPMTVRVVEAPDCEVTIRAVDRETQTPLAGARVVMHPYRAVTDESGNARVRVAKGQYDILVSGRGHMPVCTGIAVTGDVVARVELDADQPWVSPEEGFE